MGNPLAADTIVEKLQGIITRNSLPLTVQLNTSSCVRVIFDMPVSIKGVCAVGPRTGIEFRKNSNSVAWPRKDGPAEYDYRWTMEFRHDTYGFKSRLQQKGGTFNWTAVERDILEWWRGVAAHITEVEKEVRKRSVEEAALFSPEVQAKAEELRPLVEASRSRYGDGITVSASRYSDGFSIEAKLYKEMVTPAHIILTMETMHALALGLETVGRKSD